MKTPELSVTYSESIAAELILDQLELVPNGEDLAALTDHLGVRTPKNLTAAVMYPGDSVLFSGTETTEDSMKADATSVGMHDLSPYKDGVMAIPIGELSEQNILQGLAYSLMERGQFNQRMRILKWGAGTLMTELGVGTVGSTLQGPGLNWWLLGIPAAALTGAGLWLRYRSLPMGPPIVPSLEGLEPPIRIMNRS